MLNQKYGFEGFNFWDDTLTVRKDHVMNICQEIMSRGLDIKWYARRAIQLCSQAGMIVSLNFIANLPTQTISDLQMTANLIREFRQIPNVSASYGFGLIYPGTGMEQYAKENNILPNDFSWNSYYNGGKAKITGEDPSVPYMEWRGMELEKVKAFMVKNLMDKDDMLKRGWQKIKRVKSFEDIKNLFKAGINYFKV